MITVDVKSRIESTRDARTESDDDVIATMSLAISRNTLAAKFTYIARTILEEDSSLISSVAVRNRRGASSSEAICERLGREIDDL